MPNSNRLTGSGVTVVGVKPCEIAHLLSLLEPPSSLQVPASVQPLAIRSKIEGGEPVALSPLVSVKVPERVITKVLPLAISNGVIDPPGAQSSN